ncbi:AmmeMemoRadiSam system protein B [Patescibacteria group bacterium]|nr:AmmeMemoRadiSam system protein B [Patescibacteria group bacterium]
MNNQWGKDENQRKREPVGAGSFYSADAKILSSQIDQYLKESENFLNNKFWPRILIVPHAGYQFSGSIAAQAFQLLVGENFKKVILLGPAHQDWFQGISVDTHDFWQTPLGLVKVDLALAHQIIDPKKGILDRPLAHKKEHSLEVCLPFLQKTLENDFKIVPIVTSQINREQAQSLAQTLSEYIDPQTIVIVSSDLSHYPSSEIAQSVDQKIIESVLRGDPDEFLETSQELLTQYQGDLNTCACGRDSIYIALLLAKMIGIQRIENGGYLNSGDITGDRSQVVGYANFALGKERPLEEDISFSENSLSAEDRKILLNLAHQSIEFYLQEGKFLKIDSEKISPRLKFKQGAFVTLKKGESLRGCLGKVEEKKEPLYNLISKMAVSAALEDPRFQPLRLAEIEDIVIEISVLSPLQKIKDPFQEIQLGRDGVLIRKGEQTGVFLPQVAFENNWDLDEFMGRLCQEKAGLEREAWRQGDSDIYIFQAEVFQEED